MLRKEACSGSIDDLAHIPTQFCLADPLTKATITPEMLIKAVNTGKLPPADGNPMFRNMLEHKAFESEENMSKALSLLAVNRRDHWELQGSVLIRHHVRPRRCRFNPSLAVDLPVKCNQLLPTRTTRSRDMFGNTHQRSDPPYPPIKK